MGTKEIGWALDNPSILCAQGLSKSFLGTLAIREASLTLLAGRIHGIIGANGAGKSVLTKMLAGVLRPDAGSIMLDGRPVSFRNPDDALRAGIVTVHQDINLIDSMTVMENLFFNAEVAGRIPALLDLKAMRLKAAELLKMFDVDADPDARVGLLPNDIRKLVQLLRALHLKPRVLMLDEPTSSMTKPEAQRALRHVRQIARAGVAVTFISHYLDEVFAYCDDLTIVRDGAIVWQGKTAEIDLRHAVKLMIGRELAATNGAARDVLPSEIPALELSDVAIPGHLFGVSFSVSPGEVVGITGLAGSGTSDLALCLAGARDMTPASGRIAILGRTQSLPHPADAIAAGLAVVTGDRLKSGILRSFTIGENFTLPSLGQFSSSAGLLDQPAMRRATQAAIKRFNVRCTGPDAPMNTLSGGNQQKVMLAKWLQTKPKVLILDEPTIGVDVGSKDEIRSMIGEAAMQGIAVVILTTELTDLLAICSRVFVMFRGAVVAECSGTDLNEVNILAAASGNPTTPMPNALQ
jgi:ABC-type sugar transport system ATPase subunit